MRSGGRLWRMGEQVGVLLLVAQWLGSPAVAGFGERRAGGGGLEEGGRR